MQTGCQNYVNAMGDNKARFRMGRNYSTSSFVSKDVHVLFVHFKAACDSVNRLCEIMTKVRVLGKIGENHNAKCRVLKQVSEPTNGLTDCV